VFDEVTIDGNKYKNFTIKLIIIGYAADSPELHAVFHAKQQRK
jgi:hypothetical protein